MNLLQSRNKTKVAKYRRLSEQLFVISARDCSLFCYHRTLKDVLGFELRTFCVQRNVLSATKEWASSELRVRTSGSSKEAKTLPDRSDIVDNAHCASEVMTDLSVGFKSQCHVAFTILRKLAKFPCASAN